MPRERIGDLVFPTQLVDDVWEFGLIDPNRERATELVRFLFKLNLLFFDSMCLRIDTILAHPVLFSMMFPEPVRERDREAAVDVYRSGILQPVFTHDFDDGKGTKPAAIDVAESMISRHTHKIVTDDELRKHAEAIDEARFEHRWIGSDSFRTTQYDNLLEAFDRLRRPQEKDSHPQTLAFAPAPGVFDELFDWLKERRSDSTQFGLTDLYNGLDKLEYLHPIEKEVKALALAIHGYTMSDLQKSQDGTPRALTPYSAYIRSHQHAAQAGEHAAGNEKANRGAALFSLSKIADLDLTTILTLRNVAEWRNVREGLRLYRQESPNAPPCSDILTALERCSGRLADYADMTESERDQSLGAEFYKEAQKPIQFVRTMSDRLLSLSLPGALLEVVFRLLGVYRPPRHEFTNTAWITRNYDDPVEVDVVRGRVE